MGGDSCGNDPIDPCASLRRRRTRPDPFSKVGRCALKRALDLAYRQRWVAEWLFPSDESSATHPTLAPEAFENALGVHMAHQLSAPDYDSGHSMLPDPGATKLIYSKEMNMLIVPVLTVSSVTVGYSFCSGHQYSKLAGATPISTVSGKYIMSRFAYDVASRQILFVAPSVATGATGILQLIFHCDGSCERNYNAVPTLHYTPDNMPSVVLTSMCNLETRDLSSTPDFQFAREGQAGPASAAPESGAEPRELPSENVFMDAAEPTDEVMTDFLRDLDAVSNHSTSAAMSELDAMLGTSGSEQWGPPSSPGSSWTFRDNGETDDGVGVPRKPGGAPTSSGAFNMSALQGSLATLERQLKGSFFALRAKRDIMDPVTGDLLSRQTGHQLSVVKSLDPLAMANLKRTAAQHYYGSFLSSRLDASLVTSVIAEAASSVRLPPLALPSTGTSDPDSETVSPLGITPPIIGKGGVGPAIAPRPQADIAPVRTEEAKTVSAVSAVDKAEAKKIRNRLSAAKSNQRRRMQIEAQKRELVILHQRVRDLKLKKQQIMEENEMLRSSLMSQAVDELS